MCKMVSELPLGGIAVNARLWVAGAALSLPPLARVSSSDTYPAFSHDESNSDHQHYSLDLGLKHVSGRV